MKTFATLIIFTALTTVSTAQADLVTGLFKGTDADGHPCEINVVSVGFEGERHPLNERVTVTLSGQEWKLAHPAEVNETKGKVRFNHNSFRGILPNKMGAAFLRLNINHEAEPHAPTSYTFINDNYRDESKTQIVTCEGLTL